MIRPVLLALTAMTATAACTQMDGGDASAPMAASAATPTQAMPFVAMAGASDQYEIQSSQLALQKSRDANIRQFAQMMIAHHTQTTEQVTAAAKAAGMNPPPPTLMPMQRDMIAQLQPFSGAEFDRVYVSQQVRAHEMALALHSNYAERGDTPQLRTAANGAVPIVRQHLEQVRGMAS